MMVYELRLETTEAGVGFFDAFPERPLPPPEALAYLKAHPNDEFMRKYVLRMLGQMDEEEFHALVSRAIEADPPEFQALLFEACLFQAKFVQFAGLFEDGILPALEKLTPLPLLRGALAPDRGLNQQWMRLFRDNLTRHQPIPLRIAAGLKLPVTEEALKEAGRPVVNLAEVAAGRPRPARPTPRPSLEETFTRATKALEKLALFAGPEMRHEQSLSPLALMRQWHMAVEVENGRLDYGLHGVQNSYGKGLAPLAARTSLYMEIVERTASFGSFDKGGLTDRTRPHPLTLARLSELQAQGRPAMDLTRLPLEAAYPDFALNWLAAETLDGRPLLVPAQFAVLFCNLDEPALTRGLDSTGLASGNTLAEARLSGLLEVIERDAEAVTPFAPGAVFRLAARDPQIAGLLADYEARGVHVQCQDLGATFGVPCYKVFVVAEDGSVAKGTAAKLSGPAAMLSALFEVPHPYPDAPPTAPAPQDLPVRVIEDLPDFSTGDAEADLGLLDACLRANGYTPCYLDLTREDVGIPVARAFVPGLEWSTDFGPEARVSPRLIANFRRMYGLD